MSYLIIFKQCKVYTSVVMHKDNILIIYQFIRHDRFFIQMHAFVGK